MMMTTKQPGLMRVFWPSDAPRDHLHGVLVGWRNSELDVLVVAVLQGVDVCTHSPAMATTTKTPH